jgi:hypothetical protein
VLRTSKKWTLLLSCPLAVFVALQAGSCAAHQKWLLPNFFVSAKGPVWLSFDVTWSDRPFTAEAGVGVQPLWIVTPAGERQKPSKIFVGKTKSVAEVELIAPGTYRLEAVDPLAYWSRVVQDGKEQWLRKAKNEVQAGQIKRSDLYWSKAAAYVTLGTPTDIPRADNAEPLDFLLDQHPNRLVSGERLSLQVISYGKLVSGVEVKVFGPDATGHDPSSEIKCGKDGRATYTPESAGRYLFVCTLEREVTDDPKADIHSFNIYLTLEIQPRPE